MQITSLLLFINTVFVLVTSTVYASSQDTGNVEISAFADQGVELQAEIAVDGRVAKEKTPTTLILPEGRHTIVITYAARRWEREIKVVRRRVIKVRAQLIEEVEDSTYSLAIFAGGGYTTQGFEYNDYVFASGYKPSLHAAVDVRSNRWPVSILISGSSLMARTSYGYPEQTLESAFAQTTTTYEITLGPVFYFIFDRSLRNKVTSDVPHVGENFLAVQLIVPTLGFWSFDQSIRYLNDNRTEDLASIVPIFGLGLNLYGQSKYWCGKAGLSMNFEQPPNYMRWRERPTESVRAFSHVGVVIEVGRVIGL